MSTLRIMAARALAVIGNDDDTLDNMNAAYWVEYDRWVWRRKVPQAKGFELVRNSSPGNNIISEDYQDITNLTKRECKDRHDAEAWCKTYATRAAMKKALEAIR